MLEQNIISSDDDEAFLRRTFVRKPFGPHLFADASSYLPARKPKHSRKVRKLDAFKHEMRLILSTRHHGLEHVTPVNRNYHYKARAILQEKGAIFYTKGFYNFRKRRYYPATYATAPKFVDALARWEGAIPQQPPEPRYNSLTTLNEFYACHRFYGCSVPHLIRNMKTKSGDVYGRLYAIGSNNFQGRKNRQNIVIDGERCVEIDISASHLTGFLASTDFDKSILSYDLYQFPDIPRPLIKLAVLWMLGKGQTEGLTSWYQLEQVRNGDVPWETCRKYKPGAIIKRVLDAFPQLQDVDETTCSKLVFAESEVMLRTITELMDAGIVALPTHDAIVVKERDEEAARKCLEKHYFEMFDVVPRLKVTRTKIGPEGGSEPSGVSIEEAIQEIMESVTVKQSSCCHIISPPTPTNHILQTETKIAVTLFGVTRSMLLLLKNRKLIENELRVRQCEGIRRRKKLKIDILTV